MKDLMVDLYRMDHGLSDEARIDCRGIHFWYFRLLLRLKISNLYKESPLDYHRDGNKFVIEWLLKRVQFEIDENPSSFTGLPTSEKSLRMAIRDAIDRGVIPRHHTNIF